MYERGGCGNVKPGRDLNPISPAFESASQACQSLAPHGSSAPGQSAQVARSALKFTQCMRSHGMPKFPDPKVSGGRVQIAIPQGIDPELAPAPGRATGVPFAVRRRWRPMNTTMPPEAAYAGDDTFPKPSVSYKQHP